MSWCSSRPFHEAPEPPDCVFQELRSCYRNGCRYVRNRVARSRRRHMHSHLCGLNLAVLVNGHTKRRNGWARRSDQKLQQEIHEGTRTNKKHQPTNAGQPRCTSKAPFGRRSDVPHHDRARLRQLSHESPVSLAATQSHNRADHSLGCVVLYPPAKQRHHKLTL